MSDRCDRCDRLVNPYWEAVRAHVTNSRFWGTCVMRWNLEGGKFDIEGYPDREKLVKQYAWCVTDPASVEFIARHAAGGLVDPMAGTGYWAYLLEQAGIDVVSYDIAVAGSDDGNAWHGVNPAFVDVIEMDCADAAVKHPEKTLFMSWPPYSEDAGYRALSNYTGTRVIVIGEGEGGCTGDDALFNALDANWREIAEHIPVQWEGVHDRITVYERAVSGVPV
jgi:hypothetical protein